MIVREEEPIARHLPLRATTGCFERWVVVDDEAELVAAVKQARADKLPVRVLPPFSDTLPPEGGVVGVALRLGRGFEFIRPRAEGVEVGAAVPLALWMPGASGTLVDALDDGWILPAVVSMRRFRGRGFEAATEWDARSLVVSAVLSKAKVTPTSAGTAFREPKKRGLTLRDLLRRVGVGELRLGGAALAEDDPAVVVNRGEATPKQVRLVLGAVTERVRVATGLELDERLVAPGRGGRLG